MNDNDCTFFLIVLGINRSEDMKRGTGSLLATKILANPAIKVLNPQMISP